MSRNVIPLGRAITHDGTVHTLLQMRRPTKRDDMAARRAETDPKDVECRLFANLCEVAPDVIEEMRLGDYLRVQSAFKAMIEDGEHDFEPSEDGGSLTLNFPVTHGGTEYARIDMRHPLVREEKKARKGTKDPNEQECRLFTMICDVPRAVIDALDLADYDRLQQGYLGFFEDADIPV